jgi:hypothetical protein
LCAALDSQHHDHDWDNTLMKKLFPWVRANPNIFYLALFILMIVPGLILFFAVENDSGFWIYICLSTVVIANVVAVTQ